MSNSLSNCDKVSSLSELQSLNIIDIEQVVELFDSLGNQERNILQKFLGEIELSNSAFCVEGKFYPKTLIAESYFPRFMDAILEDADVFPKNLPFYLTVVVDYTALKDDYGSADLNGTRFFFLTD